MILVFRYSLNSCGCWLALDDFIIPPSKCIKGPLQILKPRSGLHNILMWWLKCGVWNASQESKAFIITWQTHICWGPNLTPGHWNSRCFSIRAVRESFAWLSWCMLWGVSSPLGCKAKTAFTFKELLFSLRQRLQKNAVAPPLFRAGIDYSCDESKS